MLPAVNHNTSESRFELQHEGACAVLEYQRGSAHMTIHHTFVPPQLRGKGVAAILAKAAFDYAREQEWKVVPCCSYIATYAKRFPEANELIIETA